MARRHKELTKLKAVIALLVAEEPLPSRYRDHALTGRPARVARRPYRTRLAFNLSDQPRHLRTHITAHRNARRYFRGMSPPPYGPSLAGTGSSGRHMIAIAHREVSHRTRIFGIVFSTSQQQRL
ncbi:type II toxin-antitoxin system YafQ family toxin [Sulfobacillus thermotolerans]|uniref:type II toxin-antitoxin system YafQ family toxin n=1 Tax=Sulfobacillus thermotolerans TaxID=338644 RepID=UPI003D2FB054